ncbi:MAG: trypsin-like serine protease [Bdellovibrionaceae bacterium]|jgi:hypothetical protein|nr:trypsin-like serine protease [Pseudobdellovibrionaceae bacterium]
MGIRLLVSCGVILSNFVFCQAFGSTKSNISEEIVQSLSVAIAKQRKNSDDQFMLFCSGTFLDKYTIITASHCLQSCTSGIDPYVDEDGDPRCDLTNEIEKLRVVTGPGRQGTYTLDAKYEAEGLGDIIEVDSIIANPYFKVEPDYMFKHDLAIITLKEPALIAPPLDFVKILKHSKYEYLLRDDTSKVFYNVGFGARENDTGGMVSRGQRGLRVFEMLSENTKYHSAIDEGKFELSLTANDNERMGCKGDSGSGTFVEYKDDSGELQLYLISVQTNVEHFSYKREGGRPTPSKCGNPTRSLLIDYQRDWLAPLYTY